MDSRHLMTLAASSYPDPLPFMVVAYLFLHLFVQSGWKGDWVSKLNMIHDFFLPQPNFFSYFDALLSDELKSLTNRVIFQHIWRRLASNASHTWVILLDTSFMSKHMYFKHQKKWICHGEFWFYTQHLFLMISILSDLKWKQITTKIWTQFLKWLCFHLHRCMLMSCAIGEALPFFVAD